MDLNKKFTAYVNPDDDLAVLPDPSAKGLQGRFSSIGKTSKAKAVPKTVDDASSAAAKIHIPVQRSVSEEPKPSLASRFIGMVSALIDSAAGYDEKILETHGTPTDFKRRRNIGRAILVATAVGSLGWFSKIAMSFPGYLGIPVALTVGALYAVLSYSLESFFAANVDPFASVESKLMSLFGRVMLSAVIAMAGAMPWVTITLKPAVEMQMSKMAVDEQAGMRKSLNAVYGVESINGKATDIQNDLQQWSGAVVSFPAPIQRAMDQAAACFSELASLKEVSEKKVGGFNAQLNALDRKDVAPGATPATLKMNESERIQIRRAIAKVGQDVATKRGECNDSKASAEKARSDHVKFATEQRDASQVRLAAMRQEEDAVSAKLRTERDRADKLIEKTSKDNSSAEFAALLQVIQNQLFAQVFAGMIFLGLLLIDSLPLTLRLFARPGPYDSEKRADDDIKRMRSDGRWMQARLMHEARIHEMESTEFKSLVRQECRPHIQSIILNGVTGFLKKNMPEANLAK